MSVHVRLVDFMPLRSCFHLLYTFMTKIVITVFYFQAKDTYESKLSLASRIVNVERQVDTIEEKLQNFLDMYLEDRKKILAIAVSTETLLGAVSQLLLYIYCKLVSSVGPVNIFQNSRIASQNLSFQILRVFFTKYFSMSMSYLD